MNINDYIKFEVDRQHRDNYDAFQRAWTVAHINPPGQLSLIFPRFVMMIAKSVEPTRNHFRDPRVWDNLRRSPVTFMHGGSACPPAEVPERFAQWVAIVTDMSDTNGIEDTLIKQLLDIHPWEDGNGRTASILRNWMLGTLDDPTPLPYYYGDN